MRLLVCHNLLGRKQHPGYGCLQGSYIQYVYLNGKKTDSGLQLYMENEQSVYKSCYMLYN